MAIDIIARGLGANAANKASQAVGLTGGTINGDLNINGNLTVSGASYETHIEQIYTKDDYIALRDGAISGLTDGNYTGFEAVKYDGVNNGRLVFDNTGTARVGDVGSEQPLATRDESTGMTDNALTYWSASENKIKTAGNKDAFVPYTGGTNNVDLGIHNLTVDTNTLHVDSVNHRVGIGTTSPSQQLEITKNFTLPLSTYNSGSTYGVIYKGTDRFIHDFNYGNNGTVTTEGRNLFIGINAGNFTMGSTATQSYHSSYNVAIGYKSMNSNTTGYQNIGLGFQSLYSNTTGGNNSALGYASLYFNTTGSQNSALGYASLYFNTTGNYNSAQGHQSLYFNTTGYQNSALGSSSLYSNTTGSYNSALGSSSLFSNTTGNQNSALGSASLRNNTTGSFNSALGYYSLYSNVAGSNGVAFGYESQRYANDKVTSFENKNTSVGYQSLRGSTTPSGNTGNDNTAIGYQSLLNNMSGNQNSALGSASLYSNTTGSNNSALGYYSLYYNTTGSFNSALGMYSLRNNTTGSYNSTLGLQSLYSNTTGYQNSALGSSSLFSNTTGSYNSALGYSSLSSNTTGSFNSALGYSSLYFNTTGSNNSALGRSAGDLLANGMGRDSGDNGVYIGYDTRSAANGTTNEIVIGSEAVGAGSNTAVLGSTGITKTLLNGNVGIGTTTPTQQLEITKNFSLPLSTYNSGSTYGVIYKGADRFIHDFNYGNNGTVTTEGRNLFIGINAGNFTMGNTATQSYNSSYNIGIGYESMHSNTTGSNNTAIGYQALYSNTTGDGNVAIGGGALYSNTEGYSNFAIGGGALYSNTEGYSNFAIGGEALYSNTEGYSNFAIGDSALYRNISGSDNMAIGYYSLCYNTEGSCNIAVGSSSLSYNTEGYSNTAVGYEALCHNTIGNYNASFGYDSLFFNTIGNYNASFGYNSLYGNKTGSTNSAFGTYCMYYSYNGGNGNSAFGYRSLYNTNNSNYNVAFGHSAGEYNSDGSTRLYTNNGVYIGYNTRSATNGTTNEIVIGANAIGQGSNTAVLGSTGITKTLLNGNVGVGTTMPNSKLEVAGSLSLPYVSISTGYTVTENDYTIHCTGNSFTVTLPTAVGIAGRIYNIKNTGAGTITVDADGTETIDGLETQSVTTGVNLQLQSTGSGWIVIFK